jgi:hypothetical protein
MRNLKKFENFSDDLNREHDGSFTKNDQNFDNLFSKDEEAQNDEESVDVLARFEEEFGDNEPSNQELMEFYHKLRKEGVDGIEIFDTLLSNNKIGEGDDENYSDDDDDDIHLQHRNMSLYDENPEFDFVDEDEDEEGHEEGHHYEGLKKFSDFK